MNKFLVIGLTGLAVVFLVNIVMVLIAQTTGTIVSASNWWDIWFPIYIVWITFLTIGLGRRNIGRNRRDRGDSQ